MPMTYAQNKAHIMKWRLNNTERSQEIGRKSSAVYYFNNKDAKKRSCLGNYYYKKECKRLCGILMEDLVELDI